jgi:tetratricopeptide (TPR) repeat protein
LQREFENISSAWQRADHEGTLDLLRQSLGGLATYYARTGHFHEGIQVLMEALTAVENSPPEHRQQWQGWLHVELARLQAAVAQLATAKNHAETACQISIALDDALLQGWARFRWSRVLWMQAHYEESRIHLEAALAIAQTTSIKRLEAECWLAMSALADTHGGNFTLAREYGEKALSLFRVAGNRLGELRMLILLGNFGWATGDYGLSQGFYEYTLPLAREVNSRSDEAAALANLGMVLREQGDYAPASVYAEQALRLFQEMGDQRRAFVTLSNISLLRHQMGQDLLALGYAQQALAIARELETLAAESQPLCCLGHALLALNRPQEATVAYAESVRLHCGAGNVHLAMDPLAGLARVALAQQDMPQAMAYGEEILAHLAQGTLDGTSEPIRVLWTVYEVLMTAQDARAQDKLAEAHQALMVRADKMADRVKRQLFLTNIAVHRAVQAAWAKQAGMIYTG